MWFLQIEDSWQCRIKQVHRYRFANSIFSPCVSMSRFGKFHSISDFVPVSCYGDLGSVIFHVHIVIVLVHQEPCLHNMMNMTGTRFVCFDCSTIQSLPTALSPGSLFTGRNDIKLRPVNNPIVASKCSIKERVNPCGQLSPFLFLRNCHSHPTLQPQPWLTAAINNEARPSASQKTLHQPKDPQWRLRWCLGVFSNKVFVN